MNKKNKIIVAILSSSLIITPISGIIYQNNNIAEAKENNSYKGQIRIKNFLKRQLNLNAKEAEELIQFLEKTKAEGYNSPEAKERGKFSFLRGTFKILVRNVDAIPSSKVRNYIRLHGNKIVDAVDYIESNSIAGATIAFQKVGIPYPQARLLAEFVIFFIL